MVLRNLHTPVPKEDQLYAGIYDHKITKKYAKKLKTKIGDSKVVNNSFSIISALINGIFPIIFVICFMLFLKLLLQGDQSGHGNVSLKHTALNLTNIFKLLIFISSYIIVFFLLFFTIITNRIMKGIFLMFGVCILMVLIKFLKKMFSVYQDPRISSLYCNILKSPFTVAGTQGIYSVPSTNITISSFIFYILISPMIKNRKEYDFNYPLFMFLLFMIIIVSVTEYFEGCVPKLGIFVGIVVGILYGFIYQSCLKIIDKNNIDYSNIFQFGDDSALCNLDKLSKKNSDGSLVPNENTKYFKCVTKRRQPDGSDFKDRINNDDNNSEDESTDS